MTMRRRLAAGMTVVLILAAAAATLGLARGDKSPQNQESETPGALIRDLNLVLRAGPKRIGRDYACAVLTRATDRRPRELIVFVTDRSDVAAARRVRDELERPNRARIEMTSKRFRHRVMTRIYRSVVAATPTGKGKASSAAVGLESPLRRARCPRLAIEIEPRGVASESIERWAADAVRRHGRDRVVVKRVNQPFVAE